MTEDLTFRLARSSNFDEILKLSEGIYNGHDYLPLGFHTWMKMKEFCVYMLAFSGEKLVSLQAFSVVDNGRTFVSRAGRTLPDCFADEVLVKSCHNWSTISYESNIRTFGESDFQPETIIIPLRKLYSLIF